MRNRWRTYVKRKLSGKDCHSSYTQRVVMDDRTSTQSFSTHHLHHGPSIHLTMSGLQSPELGYPSSQPALDPLEQYGSREEESATSFPTSNTCSVGRRVSNGSDGRLLNTSGNGLDGDANLGGHLDRKSGMGSPFVDTWYGGSKKDEVWEFRDSFESAADNFYSKGDCYNKVNDVFHTQNCSGEEGIRLKLRAKYNNYTDVSYEVKSEAIYHREVNVSQHTTPFNRSGAGSFSDSSLDYGMTDSRVSDNYVGREDDYGSSCGSVEDQLQPAEVDGPWLSASPSGQSGEAKWRGAADTRALASGCLPQRSPIGVSSGTYAQKLDSFSEAFLSHRKRRFSVIPSGDSAGQSWEFGVGRGEGSGLSKSRHSCAFDCDSLLPPASSSPPAYPSLAPFPSPPASSHLMSSVLSPPPTPRPPPSYSPSKLESSSALRGNGHSVSQGGEPPLQFFASHPYSQPLPSIHSSGVILKFPLLAHNFPQTSANPRNVKGTLGSSHGDSGCITASQNPPKSLESSFLASLNSPSAHCPPNTPPFRASFYLPSLPSQHYEAVEKIAPYVVSQRGKNGSASLNRSQLQHQVSQIYTGTPFPSLLHSSRCQKGGHYTPRPLLNPARRGIGLYSSLSSLHHRKEVKAEGSEEDGDRVLPYVNVGRDFQAELPPCLVSSNGSGLWSPEEESPREQLLWKPWNELQENNNVQDQVEKLLSMCSSGCLPGGGSNTELALHCLHCCQGNTMATLEMLLFSQPLPIEDYHYAGSDLWTDTEKNLFSAALGTHGKEFSLIQKMVRTKTMRQCVEFFYLNKKLQDKQEKQKEEEENRDGEVEQQTSITPTCQPVNRLFALKEVVPVPSLASFFPCKLCGKMFYKIKSRNAHMKIHRQPQEDWTDRRLQHHLLTQRLGSNLLPPQVPAQTFSSSCFPGTTSNSNADNVLSSLNNSSTMVPNNASALNPGISDFDGKDSNQREPTAVLSFHQSWGSFEHGPDSGAFFCNTEGKDSVGAVTVGAKEPISWQ